MNDITIKLGLDDAGLPQPVQRVNAAIGSIGKAGEISARQTAAAMRTLPAQFTDIATQLAGGQNPLLILLQQGGQIKDSFGGIRPAMAALVGAISPVGLAVTGVAAAVGVLGAAVLGGQRDTEKLRDTMALTGNAAGLTADRMDALAERTTAASGQTVGAARDIALALAASGRTSAGVLQSQAEAVARIADLTGQAGEKVAAQFAQQLKAPAEFAAKLNEQYNFLSVAQFKRIQQLQEEGRAVDAVNLTNEALTGQLRGQRTELGLLERMLEGTSKGWSSFWESVKSVGREDTVSQQLEAARSQLAVVEARLSRPGLVDRNSRPYAQAGDDQLAAGLRTQVELLNLKARAEMRVADAASASAEANRRGIAQAQEDARKSRDKPAALGAIRTAQDLYKNDFLRGEKADYGVLQKQQAEQQRQDQEDQARQQKINADEQERYLRRLAQQDDYLQSLRDANARGGAELIADEQERGRALVELDRQIALRRLDAMGLQADARSTAEDLINRRASQAIDSLGQDLRDTTHTDVRDALSAALRDTRDPVRAFAEGLGNAVYTRLLSRVTDAMATAAVGKDGTGGLFGDLLSIIGGGMTVDTAGSGIGAGRTDGGVGLPTRGGMATGTNYVPRDMVALLHKGEAIVPARYNPAAGGAGARGGGGGILLQPSITIHVDARSDAAQVAQIAREASAQGVQATFEALREQGRI